ncbi:hypothetical protein D3C76_1111330 [compost metagenome]
MLDTFSHTQGRPGTAAFVVGVHGGVQGGEGGVGIEQWCVAEDHLALFITLLEPYRAAHGGQRPVPALQLAVDQVLALHQRFTQAIRLGDLVGGGKQRIEQTVHGRSTSFSMMGETFQFEHNASALKKASLTQHCARHADKAVCRREQRTYEHKNPRP